jgi:hypothetical protein
MSGYGQLNQGTGPGTITPDGCAVDLYTLLRPGREPEIVPADGAVDRYLTDDHQWLRAVPASAAA